MKMFFCLIVCLSPMTLCANPMFANNTQNSVGIMIANSSGQGNLGHLLWPWDWKFTPMSVAIIQYSQPMKILRLPARVNLQVLQNWGYNSEKGTSFGAIGISWDIALFSWCGWYFGAGIGPYMRDSGDKYVESRLVFGEKVFIGKNISQNLNAEIFTLHFSNGDFTKNNHGFNFLGLGINYSF